MVGVLRPVQQSVAVRVVAVRVGPGGGFQLIGQAVAVRVERAGHGQEAVLVRVDLAPNHLLIGHVERLDGIVRTGVSPRPDAQRRVVPPAGKTGSREDIRLVGGRGPIGSRDPKRPLNQLRPPAGIVDPTHEQPFRVVGRLLR